MIRIEATALSKVGAALGEGPIWVDRDHMGSGALWFVDIAGQRIHRLDPATGALDAWDAPEKVGWVLPAAGGQFLTGLANGIHLFSPQENSFALRHGVEADDLNSRLNDAAVDPAGRLWFGTMNTANFEPTGRLYLYQDGFVRDSGIGAIAIPNGPAISPDGKTIYVVDTVGAKVDSYPVDQTGQLGEGSRYLTFDHSKGFPDGACCDAEGGVWLGFWGGWAARRYDAAGAQTHEVRFSTANVTKLAIGGPNGRTAYATTAREGLTAEALVDQPNAGDVFTFQVDIPGTPPSVIGL